MFWPNILAIGVLMRFILQQMIDLDKINDRILSELEADGRISNAELANRVGLSPSACLRRVQELERQGIIKGYRAVLDRAKLGSSMTIFVMVALSGQLTKDSEAFADAMARVPEVRECHNITGNVEYLLRVEVASLEDYKRFHSEHLGTLKQVASITSHFCLGSTKDFRA